jgi:quinol-cytochrome oxidoreductase complex cytochrome b subunit
VAAETADGDTTLPGDEHMWTARLRRASLRALPPGKLLPDRQPSYVASWVYVFGVLSLAAFVVILASGVVLILKGPSWWHQSTTGLFFNSIHLWSVELFFFFMVLHLWGKFFMAAWRGKRAWTWMTGVIAFLLSIGAAFTGYLSQQNFDSQWISTQAKDGLNAVGVGAFFNVLNFGQMLLWHVLLLPVAVAVLVGVHLLLVRHRGVVRPITRATRRAPAPRPTPEEGGP